MTDQVARLEYVVREQMRHIDELRAKYDGLMKAVLEEFGAHGSLMIVYSDPTKPESLRVKAAAAAIPYEKAKVGSPPQEHQHFHLFAHLERARLEKSKARIIEVKPHPPDAA
jgi:hypothetical protein